MLSATVPNALEFAGWVARQRNSTPVYVVTTPKRPVPLEHHLYCPQDKDKFVKIVYTPTYHQNRQSSVTNEKNACKSLVKFDEERYLHALKLHQEAKKSTFSDSKSVKQQGTIFTDIIYKLKKDQLLPAVFFIFSRKGCEEALEACAGLNLTSDARERSAIHMFLQEVLEGPGSPLSPQDILLPQITRMREAVERGLAVHHSGVLPVLKEAVEILFGRGLLKVLFATETFAMGVNMPARTVVFASTRKHDGVRR